MPLSDLIDDGRPLRVDFLAHEWKRLGGEGMKIEDARDAVEAIEPQVVIETILSREWENWGTETRWQQHWQALDRRRKAFVKGKQGSQRRLAEVLFFMAELDKIIPGRRSHVEPKVWRLAVLGAACARMESAAETTPEAAKEGFSEGLALLTAHELLHSDRSMVAMSPTERERFGVASIPAEHTDPETPLLERSDAARHKMLLQQLQALGAVDDRYEHTAATFGLFWAWSDADPSPRSEVAELVREAYRRQRQSVLDRMSKADQKPGFCVQRSAAGSEKDRIFPKQYSWKGWYVGPRLTKPQKDK